MKPIYLDLHIHTSENPNNLIEDYDINCLLDKISQVSYNSEFLISLTDHNVINKKAYLNLIQKTSNVLLGVELHIRNYESEPPYHCHIIFNLEKIDEQNIDKINSKLEILYPDKVVNTKTPNVPKLQDIINCFDSYDFLLLPHGGQSHSTFDTSIPKGVIFDTTLERSIYYNQFDGFTARTNEGVESTVEYFKRLGINEFVNLVTCSDNYKPSIYPNPKADNASPFIQTWMLSLPTFNGLRLSLSESSRLVYSSTKPNDWSEYIGKVVLKNDMIDIDVNLTPGLNVIIGGSSSGKTLFVDSIYRKLSSDYENCQYGKFGIDKITVENPSGSKPHYISQNYIIRLLDKSNSENNISEISILKSTFPGDRDITKSIENKLADFKKDISKLIKSVKTIEEEEEKLSRIPILSRLILKNNLDNNILDTILPPEDLILKVEYSEPDYIQHIKHLDTIDEFIKNNLFVDDASKEINEIKEKLKWAYQYAKMESTIRLIICKYKVEIDSLLYSESKEQQTKKQNFDKLINSVRIYMSSLREFYSSLDSISKYSITCETQQVNSMGHTLYIENNFHITKDKFLEVINNYLKTECKIEKFEDITPQNLFRKNYKIKPKIQGYDDFELKVYSDFEKLNNKVYKIKTSDGRNFDDLSAGWKTSVLLDIILGYTDDIAPLIIDQPEDNLATNYINHGLVNAIKKIKNIKQVIIVSHNATIPMLGDAQNIILCQNNEKIVIRSSHLEGKLYNKNVLDYIAEITDGGKPSIKKRVKKYNLKNYREEI